MAIGDSSQAPRLEIELTSGCDHRCEHCYNVWNAESEDHQGGYPRGQLPTEELLTLIDKAVKQSGAGHITVTGGEPVLHPDAEQLLSHFCSLVPSVSLITNGGHMGEARAKRLAKLGLGTVQLTLLSAIRDLHDRIKGVPSFDDTLRAALDLRDAGISVQICHVATRQNEGEFEGVMELTCALGLQSISYNRMSAAGWSIHALDRLLPSIEHIEADLEVAQRLGSQLKIKVATAMPIPPCLIHLKRYPWVRFGFCSVGSSSPNIVIDPFGNLRSCNLSSQLLGNIREQSWAEIFAQPYLKEFKSKLPKICRGCAYERSCQGGCKESGFAAYGDLCALEPFIERSLPQ